MNEENNEVIIGYINPKPSKYLVTVEKLQEGEKEPYFLFFDDESLEESTSVAKISIYWPEYVEGGWKNFEHFDLSPEQIGAMLSFMNEHPTVEGYEHLTNWQYCLVLFNQENKDNNIKVDESMLMPNYARGLLKPLIELEPLVYYMGIQEQLMDDVHDFLLNKIEDYDPYNHNMNAYDDQIYKLSFEEDLAKEFLEEEREILESYGSFENDDEMLEEVKRVFVSKRNELDLKNTELRGLVLRELERIVHHVEKSQS